MHTLAKGNNATVLDVMIRLGGDIDAADEVGPNDGFEELH